MRRVPLSPALRAELRLRVGRLLPIRDSSGFTRQVRKHSDVERFHPHQLRHTFACRWLEEGRSLEAPQHVLGHATIVMTQRYGRLSDEHVRREAERKVGEVASNLVSKSTWAGCVDRPQPARNPRLGEVRERLNRAVSKTAASSLTVIRLRRPEHRHLQATGRKPGQLACLRFFPSWWSPVDRNGPIGPLMSAQFRHRAVKEVQAWQHEPLGAE